MDRLRSSIRGRRKPGITRVTKRPPASVRPPEGMLLRGLSKSGDSRMTGGVPRRRSLHNQSVDAKLADDDGNAAARLHKMAFVGKYHPIFPAIFRRRRLAQLSYFFHDRNLKGRARLFVDQIRLGFLVVQWLGLVGIDHAIAESNEHAGGSLPDHHVIDPPESPVHHGFPATPRGRGYRR